MEKGLPKISIITICYNAGRTLERAMQSVISQQYPLLEYIIIDGGSTDATMDIVRNNSSHLAYWVSEPDKGISDAFNKGIKKATGDIIGLLNADDWFQPNTFQLVSQHFAKADVLHGKMQYWTNGQKEYMVEGNHTLLPKEMTLNHPTVFVKKEVYAKWGVFNTDYRFAMDYDLLLRFYMHDVSFFYINEVLTNMSFEGVSDKYWKRATKESKRAKIANGLPRIAAELYCVKQLSRTFIARGFKQIGLGKVLAFYRKHFALLKKDN